MSCSGRASKLRLMAPETDVTANLQVKVQTSDNGGRLDIEVTRSSPEVVRELIEIARTIKQTDAVMAVLHFRGKDLNAFCGVPADTFQERLEWCNSGQALCDLVHGSGIPFLASIETPCFGEGFELAMACHAIVRTEGVAAGLAEDGETYFPRWGALARISECLGEQRALLLLLSGGHGQIGDAILKARSVYSIGAKVSTTHLDELEAAFARFGPVARRLALIATAQDPTQKNRLHFLEGTIYANQVPEEVFSKIQYLPLEEIETKRTDGTMQAGLDDLGIDYVPFDGFPDAVEAALARKNRLAEVAELFDQKIAPLRGRCIELGAGAGYFSALLSRKADVEEVIACDLSVASVLRWGPFIWQWLKPDWSKLKYVIGNIYKLDEGHGTFDTVVFCASLHHSSDIPQSLRVASDLLKDGGVVVLHGEHYDPMFLARKDRRGSKTPHTIKDFSRLLRAAGFRPVVFRYAVPGKRFPALKRLLFTVPPFKYANGWFRFASFMMLGIK